MVGLLGEAADRVLDRLGAAHAVVVGRRPALVGGPLPVSLVSGGLPQVGQPFPFIGLPLPQVGQQFPVIGVLVTARPGLPARFGGTCTVTGGLITLDGLVGSTGLVGRTGLISRAFLVASAFLVVQASLLRWISDVSTLLAPGSCG